ncbi:sugar transferase [Texcoconibacillus texcoconensis]|uniref:Lipopolysaccharide/colanic/teichoic acid biosynthesis glycosyltransferase n=1 Tax=Texcoconibacillus texcoconensis TaxID=1095777 RepID=A0A840QSR5_9BACI|nr:sugar transferase [Texcoconibacillus texcoconensis]MBB5174566.1 lipopolysaccharide/colanic/teichoic acid biosynthesis glycosyltransferase [Texcoconibacillus texcoconensis]
MKRKKGAYERFLKRPIDLILSLSAIIILSPVLIVVALLIRTKLGSPILFKQERPGLNERIFEMYKFRTMTDERDENGELLPDHVRLTKFGNFIRSTSLDELPGLFNIVKGDMSIVGPRPLLVKYLPFYTPEEAKRHHVRPGLTGRAQVKGRNTFIWEDRFQQDLEYIECLSFKEDLTIIFRTALKVIKKSDIVEPGVLDDFDEYRRKQQSANSGTET